MSQNKTSEERRGVLMGNKNLKIVVSGDICGNMLLWRTHSDPAKTFGWQHYPSVYKSIKTGEALFLSKLVALSTGASIIARAIFSFNNVPLVVKTIEF